MLDLKRLAMQYTPAKMLYTVSLPEKAVSLGSEGNVAKTMLLTL